MKLTDLDAQFLDRVELTSHYRRESELLVGAQGIMFQCPSCAVGKAIAEDDEQPGRHYIIGAHYIQVLFSNPQGVALPAPECGVVDATGTNHPRWAIVSGTSLADLTLSPSIDCNIPHKGVPSSCNFHGYVKNGDAA